MRGRYQSTGPGNEATGEPADIERRRKLYMGNRPHTTFRPNPFRGAVLCEENAGSEAPHCCVLEREAD